MSVDFPFRYGFGIIPLLNREASRVLGGSAEGAGVLPASVDVAQSAEHPPCKRAVTSSILVVGFARKMQE